MNFQDLLRRLDIAEAAINPANSIASRLKRLTPEQREIYEAWQVARNRWARQFTEPGAMYAATLRGNDGPQLPHTIRRVLHGDDPQITVEDTDDEAARKYGKMLL